MNSATPFSARRYPRLRYGLVWCLFGTLRLLVVLPFSWQLWLGRCAGALAKRAAHGRVEIAKRNLEACFPNEPPTAIARLLDLHFAALGASVVEMAMSWYGSETRIRARTQIDGIEHLERALERGRGVILFTAHFTTFEFFFPTLARHCPRFSGMYKMQRNPLMNQIMNTRRSRNFDHLIQHDSVRDMIRELKRNAVIWYASDQSYSGKNAVLIPFFGVPAMTNTAIGRIAHTTGATVLPYVCRRYDPQARYVATIGAPIEGFPSGDAVADMTRFNRLFEQHIRCCPEQYWWVHQRFKNRPIELPDLYSSDRPN